MKDLMGMMKQVREMQGRMEQMQADLAALEVDGQSGGGLVRVTLTGKGDLKKIHIDPSLLKPDEAEIGLGLLQALINQEVERLVVEAADVGHQPDLERRRSRRRRRGRGRGAA